MPCEFGSAREPLLRVALRPVAHHKDRADYFFLSVMKYSPAANPSSANPRLKLSSIRRFNSRVMRRDLFARQQEVASPIEAKQQREDHLHAIAGDQPAREVRQILKYRIFGGEYDVAQKGEFCMDQGGALTAAIIGASISR